MEWEEWGRMIKLRRARRWVFGLEGVPLVIGAGLISESAKSAASHLVVVGKGYGVGKDLPCFLALWEAWCGVFLVSWFLPGSLSVSMFCVGESCFSTAR